MKKIILLSMLALFAFSANATTPPNLLGLLQLQQFMANYQAGDATLYTDGHGVYWTSRTAYDPVSGAQLPNIIQKADVASAQAALPLLQGFLALVSSATVATKPSGIK